MFMENFNCNKKEVRISRHSIALGVEFGADIVYPLQERFLN